jgi:hypothetical protein
MWRYGQKQRIEQAVVVQTAAEVGLKETRAKIRAARADCVAREKEEGGAHGRREAEEEMRKAEADRDVHIW